MGFVSGYTGCVIVQSIFNSLTRPDIDTRHRAAAEVAHKGSGEVVGPVGFVERF